MPELPEVETLARHLQHLLAGAVLSGVEVLWPRSIALPSVAEFTHRVPGLRIERVGRRGKFLVFSLSDGLNLLVHLRMSGQVRVEPPGAALDAYARVAFDLDDGRRMIFSDMRKFGRMYLTTDVCTVAGKLGREPLADDFTPSDLRALLAGHKGALKPLLLRQDVLAGLGNIYVDEALFAARLHPRRKADTLTRSEVRRLHSAIRQVLAQAIASRGSTLRDARYRDAEGQAGEFQEHLCVYQRQGEACVRCGTPIERIVVSQRGTHFCPRCQR